MKKVFYFLNYFVLSILLIALASCGPDNLMGAKKSTTQTALTGTQCACTSVYSPVCGTNNVTYDNLCIATCHSVPSQFQGSCKCSNTLPVCGDDGNTYTECSAQAAITAGTITSITKFADCSAATY